MPESRWIPLVGGEIEVTWRGRPLHQPLYELSDCTGLLADVDRRTPSSPDYDPMLGLPRFSTVDGAPLDHHPNDCWRCDARRACSDLGVCAPCLADLVDDPGGGRGPR